MTAVRVEGSVNTAQDHAVGAFGDHCPAPRVIHQQGALLYGIRVEVVARAIIIDAADGYDHIDALGNRILDNRHGRVRIVLLEDDYIKTIDHAGFQQLVDDVVVDLAVKHFHSIQVAIILLPVLHEYLANEVGVGIRIALADKGHARQFSATAPKDMPRTSISATGYSAVSSC